MASPRFVTAPLPCWPAWPLPVASRLLSTLFAAVPPSLPPGPPPYPGQQIRGSIATPRADVYAFGLIVYEMLTGRPASSARAGMPPAGHSSHALFTLPPGDPEGRCMIEPGVAARQPAYRALSGQLRDYLSVAPHLGNTGYSLTVAGHEDMTSAAIDVAFAASDPGALAEAFDAQGVGRAAAVIWTTTPWTLPSNQFAAIHPELTYAIVTRPDDGSRNGRPGRGRPTPTRSGLSCMLRPWRGSRPDQPRAGQGTIRAGSSRPSDSRRG